MDGLSPLLTAFSLSTAQVALFGVAALLTVGLVHVARNLDVPPRLLPLVALALGVVLALGIMVVAADPPIHPVAAAMIGLGIGLSASGMWSQAKALSGQ